MEAAVDDEVELTIIYFVSTDNVVENGIVEDLASSKNLEIPPEDVVTSDEILLTFFISTVVDS